MIGVLAICAICSVSHVYGQGFAEVLNYQPAAAEAQFDGFAHGFPKIELIKQQGESESIVGPDGKALIAPAYEYFELVKNEIGDEAAQISQILSEPIPKGAKNSWTTWAGALTGCLLVVSAGILPVFFLPETTSERLLSSDGQRKMKWLLSFSVGSLLADVFLHLLPEIASGSESSVDMNLWVLAGFLICCVAEKICSSTEGNQNKLCAVLNLIGNIIDNFTHGLAVAGSFSVSLQFGMMTTFSILLHEIPHEMIDFALLLRADFSRSEAFKAQLITASSGVMGAVAALYMGSIPNGLNGILAFTAGGFLNIGMSQLLPELNEEHDVKENLIQMGMILFGVLTVLTFTVGLPL